MKRLGTAIILLVLLTSCSSSRTQTEIGCDDLLEAPLHNIPFDTLSLETFPDWVTQKFSIASTQLQQVQYDRQSQGYTTGILWETTNKTYGAKFIDMELQSVRVSWKGVDGRPSKPTLDNTIDCLGPPTDYSGIYDTELIEVPAYLQLYLWYRPQGYIVLIAHALRDERPDPVQGNLQIDEITITRPGTVDEMAEAGLPIVSQGIEGQLIRATTPWPGSLEEEFILQQR